MTHPRILANVSRDDFVGRDAALQTIVSQASRLVNRQGLVVLAAPGVGAAELLRQAYDQLFGRRGDLAPIYFAFGQTDETPQDLARRFFQNLLQQYIAYRRVDPSLSDARMTFRDLLDLALPSDYELVSQLIEGFERERTGADERDFFRFCLNAPHRLSTAGRKLYHLLDCMELTNPSKDAALIGREITAAIAGADGSFALAGLRRQVSDLFVTEDVSDTNDSLHLERLSDDDARRLVEGLARRHQIDTNEPTRDLIVQQMNASPFLINALMLAARESKTPLTSFLNCQRLYVDELMGGQIHRHFSRILAAAAPNPQTQKTLLRVLFESASSETHKASLWAWKKRLGVDAAEFERIVHTLHVNELANSSAAFVEVNADSYVWNDFLQAQYRIEVEGQGRAPVVATTLVATLKRAPQAMARKYRREAALGLPDLLSSFNLQSVPASLFHYDRFAGAHKGVAADDVDIALDAESDLIRLPQIVFATAATSYSTAIECDRERCVVGHGFEAADYTSENEVVWLAAQIDSKLEASRELTAEWCDRLANLAREFNFARVRLWLVTPEGFSPEACELLSKREAYGSSRQQLELISARIQTQAKEVEAGRTDEYEMVIPMGSDTELIAAHTVEQIARRVNFRPEAINQIKTALIEACINAAEHSLSPDRKIYQRFRVENDKLVVTVASRGVVPASVPGANGQEAGAVKKEDGRRGWGLKLIQTLMDEVEFVRVDDGTQLKMTKYLRKV
jgi:serine/threonine-protein kinase RsbW